MKKIVITSAVGKKNSLFKKGKHILLISPFGPPNLGGVETHIKDLIKYLTTTGYQVTLLTYQPLSTNIKAPGKEEKPNLTIYRYRWFGHNLFIFLTRLPSIFNFLYLTPYLLLRSFLLMTFHHQEIDVIHVFGLSSAFIGKVLKFFFKKRTIMAFVALYNFKKETLFGRICYWILNDFDHILVSSQDSKRDVLNLGLAKEKVTVYNHWIDLENFRPGNKKEAKKRLGWEDKFTALFVGRLIPEKGAKIILEVARKTTKPINFKFIGDDGPDLAEVKKTEKQLTNVEYVGRISNEALADYYRAADVFVYPSLYQEDLARVILEALACGTPVINTNHGSGVYSLKPDFAFVTAAKSQEILEKIEQLYAHHQLRQRMGQQASVFAKKFGPNLAKKISAYY